MFPRGRRSMESNRVDLKTFTGVEVQKKKPWILVKSDAAQEIIRAVEELNWHPEPSLANIWPHNAEHERWSGIVKSVARAAMLQSGFPVKAVAWVLPFASIALATVLPCPIHAHEKDAAGNILPGFEDKLNRTCWQEHHDGKDFQGLPLLFGQLVYYKARGYIL